MIINKNIYPFVVLSEESLSTALIRIDQNRHKLIYVVDNCYISSIIVNIFDIEFLFWIKTIKFV